MLVCTIIVSGYLLLPDLQNTYSKENPLQHLTLLIAAALKLELSFLIVLLDKVQQNCCSLEDSETIRLGGSGVGAVNEYRDTSVWVHRNEPGLLLDVCRQVDFFDTVKFL